MMTYGAGNFNFIANVSDRMMFKDAYDAVSVTENWDYLRTYEPNRGFMFSEPSEEMKAINSNIKFEGHSGGSYAWTMRIMQHIATKGWDSFIDACRSGQIAGGYTEQFTRTLNQLAGTTEASN